MVAGKVENRESPEWGRTVLAETKDIRAYLSYVTHRLHGMTGKVRKFGVTKEVICMVIRFKGA